MSDDVLAGIILVAAVVCLVLIAIGLLGSVLWVKQQAEDAERDPEQHFR